MKFLKSVDASLLIVGLTSAAAMVALVWNVPESRPVHDGMKNELIEQLLKNNTVMVHTSDMLLTCQQSMTQPDPEELATLAEDIQYELSQSYTLIQKVEKAEKESHE